MGLQLIVKADLKKIEKTLGALVAECEIFPISQGLFGISIPEKSISSLDENVVLSRLEQLTYFDLWQGTWQKSKRRWLW